MLINITALTEPYVLLLLHRRFRHESCNYLCRTFPLNSITAILVYRLMMELQEASQNQMRVDSDDPLHFSMNSRGSVSFVRRIGSIGATIIPGTGRVDEEEWDNTEHVDHASDHQQSDAPEAAGTSSVEPAEDVQESVELASAGGPV